jgi:O-glycosyl hydrolase
MNMFKKVASVFLAIAFTLSTLALFPSTVSASASVVIDPGIEYQTMDGWGTSLAWFANTMGGWSAANRHAVEDLIFGPEGLDFNIARYNIGGSGSGDPHKDSLRMGGYVESYLNPDGTYDWTRDANQRLVLQEAIARGVNIAEAFSNSPPYFMTKSGTVSGSTDGSSNNLKDDQYDEFADYLTEVVKHFRDSWGITFDTLTPLNEPYANWWKAGGNQEGCHFDRSSQAQIITEVYNKLAEKGLTGTVVSTPEENSIDETVDTVKSYGADVLAKIGRINTHSYNGAKRAQINDLAKSLGKPLWMSEFGTFGGSPHDHDLISSGLLMADTIFKDIKDMQAEAWINWQIVEDEAGAISNNQNWGPIHADLSGTIAGGEEEYWLTKQYFVIKQFSTFIPQGYTIIDASSQNVVAAYNKGADAASRKLTLVARNTTSKDTSMTFDLSRFSSTGTVASRYRTSSAENCAQLGSLPIAGGRFTDVIPSNSIVTYVIDNPQYDGGIGKYINDGAAGTGTNLFHYAGTWGYSAQNGAYGNDNHYSNTADSYYEVSFTGNKAQVFAARDTNAGIAGISVDGEPETLVDCYSAGRKDQSLIFSAGGLSNGAHTLKVRVTGTKNESASDCFINADKVLVVSNDQGTTSYIPVIRSLIPGDGILVLNYTSVADPEHGDVKYSVKYGTSSGNYTQEIHDITGTAIKIDGLQNGTTYYVAVSSHIFDTDTHTWIESANSFEMSETPAASASTSLLYYVSCGDSSPISLEPGEAFGKYNGKEDQEYGMDEVTGFNWGYVADGNLTWSQDNQAAAGNTNYDSLRQYDGKETTTGCGLAYRFELPNGKYDITLGFKDPWNNSSRKENIIIEGVTKTIDLVPGDQGVYKSYGQIEVSDGMLDVRIQKNAAGSGNNPMISWIKVENAITAAPQAPAIGNTTAGSNFINVEFNESKGATGYKVKYGTSSGSYTEGKDVTQSPYQIKGLISGVKYYIAVSASNEYGDSVDSAEVSASTTSIGNVLYYVDCGDGSVNSLESGEVLGTRNSGEDQAYGADPVTGFNWGYEADDNSTWAGTDSGKYSSGVNYYTIRQYSGGTAGKGLTYRFQVPDGHYTVTLGFMDPWNNSNRKENIILNGETKDTDYVPTDVPNSKTYTGISALNGELTVRVERSGSAGDNPIISWIKIKHNLVYYADCGDGSVNEVEADEMFGLRNSTEDQAFAADPNTGYSWGYAADDNKYWRKTDGSTNYDTLIQYDGNKVNDRIPEGKGITYSFEVANGDYDVQIGLKDPWWQTGYVGRKETISIEGVVKETGYIPTTTPVSLSYQNVSVADGMLDVKIAASADAWDKPVVNWIRVEKAATAVPEPEAPFIDSVIAGNGYLRVKYLSGDGAISHKIKYGTTSGNYTNTVENVNGGIGTITGLTNGTTYYIAMTAVNEAGESAASGEVSSAPVAFDAGKLLYYADCGDSDVYRTEEGEAFGTRNSVEDQSYGVDLITGYSWGYAVDDNKYWRKTDGSTNYDTLIQYDGDKVNDRIPEGKGITYSFEVPNGNYNVEIGLMDPWWDTGYEGRKETVSIEGNVKQSGYIPTNVPASLSYKNNTIIDGILDVKVAASADAWDKPVLNWIKVSAGSATVDPGDNDDGNDDNSGDNDNGSNSGNNGSAGNSGTQAPVLENKTATVSVDAQALTTAFGGSGIAVVEIPKVSGAETYAVSLPAASLAAKDAGKQIKIDTEFGTITAPTNMLSADEIAGAQKVGLQISKVDQAALGSELKAKIGNKPVIEINLKIDGSVKSWNNPDAPVTISIPYTPTAEELADPEHIVVWYIDGSGNAISVPTGRYDKATGMAVFTTTHFSKYAVVYVKKTFEDISSYGWAKDAIEILASRGVINGTSGTTFTPGAAIKRADFIVMLTKALGLTAKADSNFTDVKAGTPYYEAAGIAKKLGITKGVGGNRFAPDETITRQDMMVMIRNAMDAAGRKLTAGSAASLGKYKDGGKVSAYAKESFSILVENKIVSGDSASNLNPLSKATRAETAVLIHRISGK